MPAKPSANAITADILIGIPKHFPARVWRRNVGQAVGMDTVRQAIGLIRAGQDAEACKLLMSRPITFGLPGEADIDGIVGPDGRRLGIEVKAGNDRMRDAQVAYAAMVRSHGGIYIVASSAEEAFSELREQIGAKL